MYFAYVDESGDSGMVNSPSEAFTLSVVLVRDRQWRESLDHTVAFRRYIRDTYAVPTRVELKSAYLMRGGGPFRDLRISPDKRMEIYKWAMLLQRKYAWPTFAIVINKSRMTGRGDPRDKAWEFAIQRLQRFAASQDEHIHLVPDAGHGYFIRKTLRAMRRFNRVPGFFRTMRPNKTIDAPATYLVEDPSERHSHESYFVQLADLNAYAATRAVHPKARMDREMWDTLGSCRLTKVNSLRGGLPGIVSWP